MKKTTRNRAFKISDFKKLQTQLKTISKGNKITIKFPLSFLYKKCVENGVDNKLYCSYLFEADGIKIITDLIIKFQSDQRILNQLLTILNTAVMTQDDEMKSLEVAETNITKILQEIQLNSEFSECQELSFNLINKLSFYELTHDQLISNEIISFLMEKLELMNKNPKDLEKQELIQIARVLNIIQQLAKSGNQQLENLIKRMISLYNQNEINFLRDLLIKGLNQIIKHQNLKQIVRNENLNIIELAYQCVEDGDINIIQQMKFFVNKIETVENIKQLIKQQSSKIDEKTVVYFSILSSNEQFNILFENKNFIKKLIKNLSDPHQSEILKFSIIKIIKNIVEFNQDYFFVFEKEGGFEQIIQTIDDPTDDSYEYLIASLDFFSQCLKIQGKQFYLKINSKSIPQTFIKFFKNLSKQYNQFKIKALTNEKAKNSIQWHKSEATKAVLLTEKNIQKKDIVDYNLAKKYLSCQQLSLSLLHFFQKLLENQAEFEMDQDFFETLLILMKVFKNSKLIFENIMLILCKSSFDIKQGKIIKDLNLMVFLCDKVWTKPEWKFFSLYCLRFIEKLIQNQKILDTLKQGVSTVKLVATIKNFLNEEEYNNFYGKQSDCLDKLTFTQEREIDQKSKELIGKLLTASVLDTFKNNINKSLKFFKTKQETITILRSEYAVLTAANGMNTFGSEGLKQNLQDWLKQNIETIEKACKNQDFNKKSMLIGDCIKSLSNYVCITWNTKGKELYEKKKISQSVFELFNKYLDKSKKPLDSFVYLKCFKQWLVERIQIIENATNLDRYKIYDKESFMMVDKSIKNQLLTLVMDSLYGTHKKFKDNPRVVEINFEVIILLGYIYPEWKSKVAQNFVPQIIEVLESGDLGKDCELKALQALSCLLGVDERSQEVNKKQLKFAVDKGAFQAVMKCIQNNNSDKDIVNESQRLLEFLGKEGKAEDSQGLLDKLLQDLRDQNQQEITLDNLENQNQTMKQINSLISIDELRSYALQKGHGDEIDKAWERVNKYNGNNKQIARQFNDIGKQCAQSVIQHQKGGPKHIQQLLGNVNNLQIKQSDILLNCLNFLNKNNKDDQVVQFCAQIINNDFNTYEVPLKEFSKKLKFQQNLEEIHDNFGESENEDLKREVKDLFFNLSEKQNEEMKQRYFQKVMKEIKQALGQGDVIQVRSCLNNVFPMSNVFNYDENAQGEMIDYVLKMLRLLHKNTKEKCKEVKDLIQSSLGQPGFPGIGAQNREILQEERALAKHLTKFILNLPEKMRERIRNHKEIVQLSNVTGLLNGSLENYQWVEDLLLNKNNFDILAKNDTLSQCIMLLLKNNKDQISGSKTDTVRLSYLTPDQKQSSLGNNIIQDNFDKFQQIGNLLLDQSQLDDIIRKYIRANNNFKNEDDQTLENLLSLSRQVFVLLETQSDKIDLRPYLSDLKKCFDKFLSNCENKNVNEKLLKFFNQNLNKICKIIQRDGQNMESDKLYNKLVDKFLVDQNQLLDENQDLIFENLNFVKIKKNGSPSLKFVESKNDILIDPNFVFQQIFDDKNIKNLNQIINNFYDSFSDKLINDKMIMQNLDDFCDDEKFCKQFVKSDKFNFFIKKFNLDIPNCFSIINKITNNNKITDKKFIQKLIKDLENKNKNKEASVLLNKISYQNNCNLFNTVPIKLHKLIDLNFSKYPDQSILLQRMINQLDNKNKSKIFEKITKNLEKSLYNKNSKLKNPLDFDNYKEVNNLIGDPIENEVFVLGTLSQDPLIAKKMKNKYFPLKFYDEFENNGHLPTIALKTLQAVRNGVYQLTIEDLIENEKIVDDLIKRIPIQIKKYKNFIKTPEYLKDILDFLQTFKKNRKPQNQLEKIIKQFDKKKNKKYDENDIQDLINSYKLINQKLNEDILTDSDAKALDILNRQLQQLINNQKSENLLLLPKELRLLANSENSSLNQKEETLILLNQMINDDFYQDDFYCQKSKELIEKLNDKKILKMNKEQQDVLHEDLKFMRQLTDDKRGVDIMLEKDIDNFVQMLKDLIDQDHPRNDIKTESLKILNNLLKHKDLSIQDQLLKDLPKYAQNLDNDFLCAVGQVAGTLCDKGQSFKDELQKQEFLSPIKKGVAQNRDQQLNKEISNFLNKLTNENPKSHQDVLDAQIMPYFASPFKNINNDKEFHKNVINLLKQLGFQKPEVKKQLIKEGFIEGLVPLLIHYSSKEHYDPEMTSYVLKCMANYSLIPEGVDVLLNDGVVPAFKDFYKEYKDSDDQQLMLQTMANLTYVPNDQYLNRVLKDKGLELIQDCLKYFHQKPNLQNTELSIDVLTHILRQPKGLEYCDKNKNQIVDTLIDILRQKQNSPLVYKSLKCVQTLLNSKKQIPKIIKKNGPREIADLFHPFQKDNKIIFQSLKILNTLAKNPENLDELVYQGIPEKIIKNYDKNWPLDIQKEAISLFCKMSKNEEVKNLISEDFLPDLIDILEDNFHQKPLVNNGLNLMALCSDNIVGARNIEKKKGWQLAHNVLDKYMNTEKIVMKNLRLMENMLILTEQTKPEFLNQKSDDLVEKIVESTNNPDQKELHDQAQIVLDLLRDKEKEEEEDVMDELEIKPDILKFLKQGRLLRVYGEDKVCRTMHFFLSKDLQDLKCKHPKQQFVKQKWIIPIHLIKDIKMGYLESSPIAKSSSFFRRAPRKEKCFVIYGPILYNGPQNFNMKCENKFDAQKWVEYLNIVLDKYKKEKALHLKQDEKIHQFNFINGIRNYFRIRIERQFGVLRIGKQIKRRRGRKVQRILQ